MEAQSCTVSTGRQHVTCHTTWQQLDRMVHQFYSVTVTLTRETSVSVYRLDEHSIYEDVQKAFPIMHHWVITFHLHHHRYTWSDVFETVKHHRVVNRNKCKRYKRALTAVPWIPHLRCGRSAGAAPPLWCRPCGRRCAERVSAPYPSCHSPAAETPPDRDPAEELRPEE